MSVRRQTAVVWLHLALVLAGRADGPWAVMTHDGAGKASSVAFTGDGAGVVYRAARGAGVTVPLRSLVAMMQHADAVPGLDASTSTVKRFFAELPTGERILADTMGLKDGRLRLSSSRWGSLEFDAPDVRRLIAADSHLPDMPPAFTGVRYANGDTAEGAVTSIMLATVLVDMPGIGKIPIDGLANVSDIALSPARPPSEATGREAEVFLSSGEILRGNPIGGSDRELHLKTAWSQKPLVIPLNLLAALAMLDVHTLLSARTPQSVSLTPYFDFQRRWRRDRSLLDQPLSVGGFAAARGLALHPRTTLQYAFPPCSNACLLVAWVGVDDAIPAGLGAADLRIAVEGGLPQTLRILAGSGPVPMRIALPARASSVSITADYGPLGSVGDHVDVQYPCLIAE